MDQKAGMKQIASLTRIINGSFEAMVLKKRISPDRCATCWRQCANTLNQLKVRSVCFKMTQLFQLQIRIR
uniref:Uncharacterized protein n=1 Tax=Tanacetum cinerariifolium TaxID=118510 RepID=A0A6L2L4B2_TANCI|nr:hypothetical protein [Tanacetum cinerariifolium]